MNYLQTISFDKVLKRRGEWNGSVFLKTWDVVPFPRTIGMCIGFRTLSNGICWYHYEDGTEYRHKETVKAALVVFHPRRKPVLVPL